MKDCNLPAPRFARYRVDHMSGLGYVVLDPTGCAVPGSVTRFRQEAAQRCDELQRAADIKAKRGPRPCLRCGTTFHSEGIHNRMCSNCRAQSDALGDECRPHIPRAGGRS